MMKKRSVSACYTRVLQVCAFVLASAFVFVGCEEVSVAGGDSTPPALSVTIHNVVAQDGTISFRVENPNAEAVRVTAAVTPTPPGEARVVINGTETAITDAVIALAANGEEDIQIMNLLTNGTEYIITLTTADSRGNQQGRKATGTATSGVPEGVPQNFSAAAADGSVSLTWTAPTSGGTPVGYRIYRATGSDAPFTRLATAPETLPATPLTYTDSSVANGTTYRYTIRSVTENDTEGADSEIVSATPLAAPNAPTALNATAGNGEAVLRWTAPTGGASVIQYYIYRVEGTDIDTATRLLTSAMITETTYTDTTAANGTAYSYAVRAVNANGAASANSNTVAVTPSAPSGVPNSLEAVSDSRLVVLEWTAPADGHRVSGYRIYRAEGDGTLVLLPTVPSILSATTFIYTDTTVADGTEYRYVVRAVSATGVESADSEVAPATPLAPPGTPTGLSASGGNGTITLTWSVPTGGSPVSQYYIYRALGRDISPTIQLPTLVMITGTTYTDTNVSDGVAYSYAVRARNANGTESENSNIVSITPVPPPNAPTALRATFGNGSARLSWTVPASGTPVTQYYIYRVEGTEIGDATRLNTPAMIATTTYTDSGLTNGTEYSYVVRAVNVNNAQSANSNTVRVTPGFPAPQAVATVVANAPQIMLTWDAIENADEYRIYRTVGEGSEERLTTAPPMLAATTYTDHDIAYGIAYRYRIQAIVGGEMGPSSTVARAGAPIDSDGDTLIDIRNLDMLNNVRYNLAGTSYKTSDSDVGLRCGANGTTACTGYELMSDLNFLVAGDYADGTVNMDWLPRVSNSFSSPENATNRGWQPIGIDDAAPFATIFEGNGRSISNLYSRNAANSSAGRTGLFGQLNASGTLRNLLIEDSNVYGGSNNDHVGVAVGLNRGTIANVAVRGGSAHGGNGTDDVGGLVGWSNNIVVASSASSAAVNGDAGTRDDVGGLVGEVPGGSITASYASGAVDGGTGNDGHVGGLVGTNHGTIRASYARGNVDGNNGNGDVVGGLVGRNENNSTVIASYATGNADGGMGTNDHVGKISGFSTGTVTASYGFGTTNGEVTPGTGGSQGTALPSGVTTAAQLTAPASASGAVAAEWNQMASSTLNAWNFGTNSQTPALRYADYDGTGGTDYCALFSNVPGTSTAITCGTTLLIGQDRGSTSSTSFDLTVSSSTANTILFSSASSRTVDFNTVVRNAYGASTSPANTTLQFYRSTDGVINALSDVHIGTPIMVPTVVGGRTYSQPVAISVPGAAGTYYYYACITATRDSNTANDCSLVTTITVILPTDSDNDTLIDIRNLDMLNNVRYNLAGTSYKTSAGDSGRQCGATETTACTGYELMSDLDFLVAGDYANGTLNTNWLPRVSNSFSSPANATNRGWQPIGGNPESFNTLFEGNGYKISNLYIRNAANMNDSRFGLFGQLSGTASIRNFVIEDSNVYGGSNRDHTGMAVGVNLGTIANVAIRGGSVHGGNGNDEVGGLAGYSSNSIIASSASTTAVYGDAGNDDHVGGLVGQAQGGNITASYASGAVDGGTGNDGHAGGLVGNNSGTIRASYALGNVNGNNGNGDVVGGLVGRNENSGTVIASYATGNADGGAGTRDHVGTISGFSTGTVTASYGFGTTSGEVTPGSGGSQGTTLPSGITTAAQLTAPASASGAVAAEWNQMASSTLNAWNFGTNSQTPALRYADYDGTGGTGYCALFSNVPGTSTAITCGTTLLAGQDRGSTSSAPFDLTVSSSIANTILVSSSSSRTVDFTTVVRNAYGASASPAATLTYYRSTDSAISTDTDTALSPTHNVSAIAGGAMQEQTDPVSVPGATGTYYYYACVSASSESNTANNCSLVTTITVVTPVDSDNDGLIDIRNLDMLNNVRHNLAGTSYKTSAGDSGIQCGANGATACTGYELLRDLDFAVASDYESGNVNMEWRPTVGGRVVAPGSATNSGWEPIGDSTSEFATLFEGNGRSIRNLYSRNATNVNESRFGLFGQLGGTASIRNFVIENGHAYGGNARDHIGMAVGVNSGGTIVNVIVRGGSVRGGNGNDESGGLAGWSFGTIIASSASTTAVYGDDGDNDNVGGLVGQLNGGSVTASYATGAVNDESGNSENVGGLVGVIGGGTIRASYARGNVTNEAGNNDSTGGLVGGQANGSIVASYAMGNVHDGDSSTNDRVGALVGYHAGGTVTASYAFGSISGGVSTGNHAGSTLPSGVMTPAQLTAPSSAATTAAATQWNQMASSTLNAWNFGTNTENPALRYADYDGAGGTDYCSYFTNVPGTDTAIDCGTTLLSGQDTLRSLPPFDLTVSMSTDTTTVSPGVPFTLTANVQNMLFAVSSPAATLTYYFSADDVANTDGDIALGTDAVPVIRGGASSTQDITITPAVESRYYYYACVRAETGEADTTNNCSAATQVTVMDAHDLAVVSSHLTATHVLVRSSTPISFSATVRNVGAVATSASAVLRYYRSANNTVDTSRDTNIGSDTVPVLAANATNVQSIMITAPATLGSYYYYACVSGLSGENVANNCSTPALVQVVPSFTLTVTTASVLVTGIRVSWNNEVAVTNPTLTVSPTPTGFTAPSATGNAFILPVTAAADTLNFNTAYTFTVNAMQSGRATEATVTATPVLPVVLWSDGMHQGDFGFARCQTDLDRATPTNAVARALKSAGYTKGAVLSSTPSYAFSDIHTDADALGVTASLFDVEVSTRPLVIAYEENGTVRYTPITNGVGQPALTVSQALATTRPTSRMYTWTNAGTRDALQTLIGTEPFWSMNRIKTIPHDLNLTYPKTVTCSGATSASSSMNGRTGSATVLADLTLPVVGVACNTRAHVLCVAR